jgi:hypothetical protein
MVNKLTELKNTDKMAVIAQLDKDDCTFRVGEQERERERERREKRETDIQTERQREGPKKAFVCWAFICAWWCACCVLDPQGVWCIMQPRHSMFPCSSICWTET